MMNNLYKLLIITTNTYTLFIYLLFNKIVFKKIVILLLINMSVI